MVGAAQINKPSRPHFFPVAGRTFESRRRPRQRSSSSFHGARARRGNPLTRLRPKIPIPMFFHWETISLFPISHAKLVRTTTKRKEKRGNRKREGERTRLPPLSRPFPFPFCLPIWPPIDRLRFVSGDPCPSVRGGGEWSCRTAATLPMVGSTRLSVRSAANVTISSFSSSSLCIYILNLLSVDYFCCFSGCGFWEFRVWVWGSFFWSDVVGIDLNHLLNMHLRTFSLFLTLLEMEFVICSCGWWTICRMLLVFFRVFDWGEA